MTKIKKFKDLGIQPVSAGFEGEKIRIDRILNREIVIYDFKIVTSKYPDKGEMCLHLQIAIDDKKHIVFSGSKVLQSLIEQVDKKDFPFETTIIKDNQRFEFT